MVCLDVCFLHAGIFFAYDEMCFVERSEAIDLPWAIASRSGMP